MPANVDSMFSVRAMPWHREGTVLDDYPGSWAEARKLAGLEWDPITEAVYELHGVDGEGRPVFEPVEGWKRISRSDNHETLSITRDSCTVIDHAEMSEIIEAVLAQANVRWETAGSLTGGRAVWCLAALDEPTELPGDTGPTMPYLAITNRHDGTAACALRATAVRIVCANTFLAQNLLGVPVTAGQRELFVREVVPMPPDGLVTDRVVANVEAARTALRNIFASPTTEGIADTAYGLVHVRNSGA